MVRKEQQTGSSIITLGSVPSKSDIVVEIGPDPQLTLTDVEKHILPVLHGAYIDFELKKEIWQILQADAPLGIKVGQLAALGMRGVVLNALLEYLVADHRS
jgi:hypothetical protein